MRYCGQSDDFACGPIAAGNALKHFELLRSFSRVRVDFLKRFKCNRFSQGTNPIDFNNGIKNINENLIVIKRMHPSKEIFDSMLAKGYGAIVRFEWAKWNTCHYAFFEPRNKTGILRTWYRTANFWGGSIAMKLVSNCDVKLNLFKTTHKSLWVWFVRKR